MEWLGRLNAAIVYLEEHLEDESRSKPAGLPPTAWSSMAI